MKWMQELQKNVTTGEELACCFPDIQSDRRTEEMIRKSPVSIPAYYLSLIDKDDVQDPIRKMCVPSFGELDLEGDMDTSGEGENTVLQGLQHKYSQTALVLSTDRCAMYCRYCFRKRMVGKVAEETAVDRESVCQYIREHPEITNVLVSGGDAFLNENSVLQEYLENLMVIPHLDYIRFGTKTPVTFPQRITEDGELKELLCRYGQKKQIYVITQFNHPREFTEQSEAAVKCLQKAGVIVKNQTVLLKGVNDSGEVLGELLKCFTRMGIIPYYVFQCRPVTGVLNQFQVPLLRGYEIVEQAKNMQNGNGKCFRYIMSTRRGKIEILGKGAGDNEMIFKFHQAKRQEDKGRIFVRTLGPDDCWIE